MLFVEDSFNRLPAVKKKESY